MIPSKTHEVVGGTTVAGIIKRSGIEPGRFYAIDGFALHELLVLADRFNYRFTDPNETRDWQNRLNSIVDTVRRDGIIV